LPAISTADIFPASHNCFKPTKPYEFSTEYEIDFFKAKVKTFKRCIQDFVDRQNDAELIHATAAEGAIEEWNRFVNDELN